MRRKISQLAVPRNPEPKHLPSHSVHAEPTDRPQTFPNDLYRCLCWGKTHPRWLQQAGMEVLALHTFAPVQGALRGAPASQASPRASPGPSPLPSTAARRGEPLLGVTPSHTGSDQEFLVCAWKKGFCLNDVLGLYLPGLTHSLEGKRGV